MKNTLKRKNLVTIMLTFLPIIYHVTTCATYTTTTYDTSTHNHQEETKTTTNNPQSEYQDIEWIFNVVYNHVWSVPVLYFRVQYVNGIHEKCLTITHCLKFNDLLNISISKFKENMFFMKINKTSSFFIKNIVFYKLTIVASSKDVKKSP